MRGGGGEKGKGLERMPGLSYVARATPDDIELVDDFRSQVFHLEAELRDQREAVRVRGSENSRTEARGGGGAASAAEHVGSACASQGDGGELLRRHSEADRPRRARHLGAGGAAKAQSSEFLDGCVDCKRSGISPGRR